MINTKDVCYLFFDYDGTVFLNGEIPKENSQAIAAAQRLGHRAILNTGRSGGGLDFSMARHQVISWDGKIFGACDMTYNGRRDHEFGLSRETAIAWVRYAVAHRYWIALEGEQENLRLWLDREDNELVRHGEAYVMEMTEAYLKRTDVTKLSVQKVDGDAPVTDESMIDHGYAVEVLPKGRDKGAAFLDFCRIHKIDPQQCVCFGDSPNDLAIFQVCPTSVCMVNGTEELKAAATYCAKTEFGVAEGLKWLFGKDLDLTNGEK